MTGATLVRRESGGLVFLSVYGAFDGASAWALRIAMTESEATEFIIDLTYVEEACEFAACILANWVREHRRERRVRVVPGEPEQARLLASYGLELADEGALLQTAPPLEEAADRSSPSAGSGQTGPGVEGHGAGQASCP